MSKAGIDDKSSKELLGIIRKRIQKNVSGASWMMDNFSRLRVGSTANEASKNITKVLYRNQMTSKPVHLWKNIDTINNRSERQYDGYSELELLELADLLSDELTPKHFNFTLVERYKIDADEEFKMEEGFNFEKIYKGEVLATNQYGDIMFAVNGNIFMPLYQNQGKDGFFIIQPTEI